jgi:hypothetical protein
MTHEEFEKRVNKIFPDIEILSAYQNSRTLMRVRDKYGELETNARNLLNGHRPGIVLAYDKNIYFKNMLKEIYGDNYDYYKLNYKNKKTKVKLICKKHGEFERKPRYLLEGRGCKKCMKEDLFEKRKKEFIEHANKIHKNKYDYSKSIYKGSDKNIEIICPKHGSFFQQARIHLRGANCPKCSSEKMSKNRSHTTEWFIKEARKIHGKKYDYSKVKYKTSDIKVCIICPKHGEFWQRPIHHIYGKNGCEKCEWDNRRKNLKDFIKEANEIHNNKYDYSKSKYINSLEYIEIICPKHGSFWQNANTHLQGSGCPKCNNSKGELKVEKWLIENNIEYDNQKTFDDLIYKNNLYFDFYLPKYNICIEYDGRQHFEPDEYFGGEEKFNTNKIRDNIKNNYCKDNDIKLIRIPYYDFDNIENILQESVEN